jgi:Tfp pilus assembly protein PilX
MIRQRGFVLLPVVLAMTLVAMIAYSLNYENGRNAAYHSSQADIDRARYAAEAGLQAANNRIQLMNCGAYPSQASPVSNSNFAGAAYSAYATPIGMNTFTLDSTGTYNGSSVTLRRTPVYAYQQVAKVYSMQPDAVTGIDTYIAKNSIANFGGAPTMYVISSNIMLLKFDLSIFPPGSIPKWATLSLTNSGFFFKATLFRLQSSWLEAGANWSKSDGINAWISPGGDYHSDPVVLDMPSWSVFTPISYTNIDITELAFAWMNGRYPNSGIRIAATPTLFTNGYLMLSDNATSAARPKLEVGYWLPCGAVPP